MSVSLSDNSAQSYSNNSSELDNIFKDQFIGGFDNLKNKTSMENTGTIKTNQNNRMTDFFKQVGKEHKNHKKPNWLKYATNIYLMHFLICMIICVLIIACIYFFKPFFIYKNKSSTNNQTQFKHHGIHPSSSSSDQDDDCESKISFKRLAILFGISFSIVYGLPNVVHIKNKVLKRK